MSSGRVNRRRALRPGGWRCRARTVYYAAVGPSTDRSDRSRVPRAPGPKVSAEDRTTSATASVQDYLAAIYDLGSTDKPVISARLAKHMTVSAPAVTEAIQRMTRGGYVKVGRGKELTLTPKGREIAEVMARRHRLLERWLTDTLGLDWTEAHDEAHRLEHAISPRVEDRLAELLGMPSTCPHGNPIPGMAKPSRVEPFPLSHAKPGATVIVERITEEAEADRKLLEHLWRQDIRPGRELIITEVAPWAGTITAAGEGHSITLGLPAAAKIWVYAPPRK
jgi:DtxR family transcriptional regulator, Mn-dependent transcriptional regulator